MKLEHLALNVADPRAMAAWYVTHLGMTIARKMDTAPHTHFLADSAGAVMLELYNHPPDAVPAYAKMNPLLLHVAFTSADPESDKHRLLAAGATHVEDVRTPDGSFLVMLRDPWGLALQLVRRATPLLKE